ncbi:class I SAM-dependent methyltransferase [Massilia endophytica]|nr:class I SAM-dependent methyltransferase [Massilia endophytica]
MRSRLWRIPALRALLALLLALAPTALAAFALDAAGATPTLLHGALLHGLSAMLIGWRLRLAAWWRPILLLFAPALLLALGLGLPSWVYLLVFGVLLLVYWSTFRTQVPYYPSGQDVWEAVAAQLPPGRAGRVVEIGSGLGGLSLYLARVRPECACIGVEIAPLPWLLSWLRARLAGSRAQFLRGDYQQLDFGAFDLVFAYLSPAAMESLMRKARAEMKPGSLLISYEFPVPAYEADKTIVTTEGHPPLYIWSF